MKIDFLRENYKPFIIILCIIIFFIISILTIYTKLIPVIVSSQGFNDYLKDTLKKNVGVDFVIDTPKLVTTSVPHVKFSAKNIELKKGNIKYFAAKNIIFNISLEKIFCQRIILKEVGADYLFADVDKLFAISKKEDKKSVKSNWKVRWFSSLLYLKNCEIIFSPKQGITVDILGKNLMITENRNPKYAHYDIKATIRQGNHVQTITAKDNNSVYIKDKVFYIKNNIITINNSKIKTNATLDEKNNYSINFSSNNFNLENITYLISSNLIIPNGSEILKSFADIKGSFNFDINIKNKGMDGQVKLCKTDFKVVPLKNLPITLKEGVATISAEEILIKDFIGFYGKSINNTFTANGTIKDYTKTVDTDVMVIGNATNELTRNYISPLVGANLELTGNSKTVFRILSDTSKINLLWMFKLAKGNDILFEGMSFSPVNYDRVLMADLNLVDNVLNIKSIDYYIASVIDENSKDIEPILTINGNIDMLKNGEVKDIGFKIPKPLPSEFLNLFVRQKLFKKGTISGDMRIVDFSNSPKLLGNLQMDNVLVPSQRLSIKKANFYTENSLIRLDVKGRFKRSDYNFKGKVNNSLLSPLVVKDADLTIDNIDLERVLNSMNQQNTNAINSNTINITDDIENDDNFYFDTNLLIVENSNLNVIKGKFKDLNFGNIKATMTLDKNGIFKLHSNRFDFAEGISTLRSICDLKNHKYNLRLGVREVNSDLISSTILNLPNEISGKANGLIVLDTDESLKLNGEMNFTIKDGTIGKIGLVEYLLRFASFFRNPIAMINPTTIVSISNIPEGKFDNIEGELKLKDNIIDRIMIKSIAPDLSAVVIGRYDLVNNDAALRIYTKFSNSAKSKFSILDNISLNGLSNVIPFGNQNAKNYYEAELKMLPPIDADLKDTQVFLTTIDGDLTTNNFISSLKKID